VLVLAWCGPWPGAGAAAVAAEWSLPAQEWAGVIYTRLAQQGGNARSRMLAPPVAAQGADWQAAKAARACASGGTVLRVDPNGRGYDVRVLVANQVVVVRVDASGSCR